MRHIMAEWARSLWPWWLPTICRGVIRLETRIRWTWGNIWSTFWSYTEPSLITKILAFRFEKAVTTFWRNTAGGAALMNALDSGFASKIPKISPSILESLPTISRRSRGLFSTHMTHWSLTIRQASVCWVWSSRVILPTYYKANLSRRKLKNQKSSKNTRETNGPYHNVEVIYNKRLSNI